MSVSQRYRIYVVLAALLVHGGVLVLVQLRHGSIVANAFNSLDSREYFDLAQNLATHGMFSDSEAAPWEPGTWRTPGYPALLAVIMLLFGDDAAPLIVMQQLLGAANALLLFIIGRTYLRERRALIVALLFLIEPYHLLYSTWLMATTLLTTTLLAAWAAWESFRRCGRWQFAALCGALVGYAILVRPIALLIPFALAAGLVLRCAKHQDAAGPTRRLRLIIATVVAFGLPCILVVGAWMVRNQRAAGHLALSDQPGVVLAYFKATEVILWRQGRTADRYLETSLNPRHADDPHDVWVSIDRRLRKRLGRRTDVATEELRWQNLAQGNRTAADSFAISKALSAIARAELLEAPLSTFSCCLVRCGALLTFPLNMAILPPRGIATSRLRSLAVGTVYTVLSVCALAGIWRMRTNIMAIWFPVMCIASLLLTTTPQLDPRFRVPMVPFLLLLAFSPKARVQVDNVPATSGTRVRSPQSGDGTKMPTVP